MEDSQPKDTARSPRSATARLAELIEAGQTDERLRAIYATLKDELQVRWKESFKQVLGLPLAETLLRQKHQT